MPFSVYITKHTQYAKVKAGAPDEMTSEHIRQFLEYASRTSPMEFASRQQGALWIFRKADSPEDEPFCRAGVKPTTGPKKGTVQLSISYTHPHFLSNMHELLRITALMCEELSLHAFEDLKGLEVTPEFFLQLHKPDNAYSLEQGRLFIARRRELYTRVHMPFEFPLGDQDSATNMALLRLKHKKLPPLAKLLADPPKGHGVEAEDTRGLWIDTAADEPAIWFMRDPHEADGLLIWPHWREEPFLKAAQATWAAAELLQKRTGGELRWNDKPCTPKLMSWLKRYPKLLGVDLFDNITQGQEPNPREPFVK
jgi:hypothetical protein